MEINMSDITSDQAQPESRPGLNIQDLVNVLRVINTCTQRGAFRAEELSGVGGLYDRLSAFVKSTGAVTEPPAEAESASTQ